jgi:hypothetical protein
MWQNGVEVPASAGVTVGNSDAMHIHFDFPTAPANAQWTCYRPANAGQLLPVAERNMVPAPTWSRNDYWYAPDGTQSLTFDFYKIGTVSGIVPGHWRCSVFLPDSGQTMEVSSRFTLRGDDIHRQWLPVILREASGAGESVGGYPAPMP